jgi:hypothetical protein
MSVGCLPNPPLSIQGTVPPSACPHAARPSRLCCDAFTLLYPNPDLRRSTAAARATPFLASSSHPDPTSAPVDRYPFGLTALYRTSHSPENRTARSCPDFLTAHELFDSRPFALERSLISGLFKNWSGENLSPHASNRIDHQIDVLLRGRVVEDARSEDKTSTKLGSS